MSIAFHREFRIWAATISHGQLLLRSVKSETDDTRVDVVFHAVSAVLIPKTINNLVIDEASPDQLPESVRPIVPSGLQDNGRVFQVSGDGFTGYVAAGDCAWREDDGELDDWGALFSGPAGEVRDGDVKTDFPQPLHLLNVLHTAVLRRRPELVWVLMDLGKTPLAEDEREGLRDAFVKELRIRGIVRPEDQLQRWSRLDALLDRLTPPGDEMLYDMQAAREKGARLRALGQRLLAAAFAAISFALLFLFLGYLLGAATG